MVFVTDAIIAFLIMIGVMIIAFIFARIFDDNSIVDLFWPLTFLAGAWYTLLIGGPVWPRNVLVMTLVTLWGVRLFWHLAARKTRKEDWRYTEFRKKWKNMFWTQSFIKIYLLQGILAFIILSPVLWVNLRYAPETTGLDLIGLGVWCIGFLFQVVGDAQLTQFLKHKKKGLLTSGLRKYTRYPSYFGEIMMWTGLWIIGISSGAIITVISPVLIYVLIRYVSGVPYLERRFKNKPGYKEYAARTNLLFPWKPRQADR